MYNSGQRRAFPSPFNLHNSDQQQQANLMPVSPLPVSQNRWDRKAIQTNPSLYDVVERRVQGLLNKLTVKNFDSISNQIILWTNRLENEKDGRTLKRIARLVFESATSEAKLSDIYASLFRKMVAQISPNVQDEDIKNNDGKPIAGGQLFRKYLLNWCQEDLESGWVSTASHSTEEGFAVLNTRLRSNEDGKDYDQEADLPLVNDHAGIDPDYAAQKAKRRGLALIRFIGELFKLQMLTERIMHECVKRLLGNVDNPEEKEIELLRKLLTTVGGMLDTPKARAHLDVYFSRMKELTKSPNVTSRMQYMLIDLIELRERRWVSRTAVGAPTTIAQIHENAAKEKAAAEKDFVQRQAMSRGGSRRGGTRDEHSQVGPNGWAVAGGNAPRAPAKAGDLSCFGKISIGQPMTFGPSSVFAGKKGAAGKRESFSHTGSSSNMFGLKSQAAGDYESAAKPAAEPVQRRRLVLQPRSKGESRSLADGRDAGFNAAEEKDAPPEMSEEVSKTKIAEDVKEFFAVRSLFEAESYFTNTPAAHHHRLVDALVSKAVESSDADVELVANFFEQTVAKSACSAEAFEAGLLPVAEIVDDIAIDLPKAFQRFATIIKAACLDIARQSNLASKSLDSDKLLTLICSNDPAPSARPAQEDAEVSLFVDMVISLQNPRKGAIFFKTIPPTRHHSFIAKVTEAALALEEPQVMTIAESFRDAIAQGDCSSRDCKFGLATVAGTISKTTRTTQFLRLATMVRGVGLDETDRGEIAAILGRLSTQFMDMTLPRGRKSDNQTVTEFLERLAKMKMCSTALFPAGEKQDAIESIVNDMALQAPEALRKLSLMVRGEGLD